MKKSFVFRAPSNLGNFPILKTVVSTPPELRSQSSNSAQLKKADINVPFLQNAEVLVLLVGV